MAALPLSPAVFSLLRSLVEERAGLHHALSEQGLFGEKVSECAVATGFDSLLDYYYFLRYDAAGSAALDVLVEALVVNETYFFREAEALEALVQQVLEPAIRAGKRPRVWCAAASTGEEPLTLAMMLASRGLGGTVDILASDISQRVLNVAQAGVYGRRSLRHLHPDVKDRYIDVDPTSVRVRPELRAAVTWRRVNLVQPEETQALGKFDVILCRNVLLYFNDLTTRKVVATLCASLRTDGVLLVGAAESLLRFGTGLVFEERGGTFFYARANP